MYFAYSLDSSYSDICTMESDTRSEETTSGLSPSLVAVEATAQPNASLEVPVDETKLSEVEIESTKLISPSPLNIEQIGKVPSTKCVRCVSAYYNKDDKSVHIPHNRGRAMSQEATRRLRHHDSSMEEVVTCVNCRQRKSVIGGKSGCCHCKNYWGILLSLASGLASTFGGLIVRHMKDFHPFSLATYRFQGIVLPTLIIVLYYHFVKKQNVFESIWPAKDKAKLTKFGFTIVRAVIGCLGLYLYFYAIKLMPLADAKVILSCRPVFVIFVARVFLGEPCGIFPVFAAMLSVIGVGIIARPPVLTGNESFDADLLMGTVFATLSMLAATLSMVVLRYLRGVHVAVVTLAFGFWGTILSLACSATVERFDIPQKGSEWILMVCLAISAFFSQTAITLAMKYEHAGAVVIVGTCDTIMSFVLQYFILGDAPDFYSLLGASLIIICVALITLRKWIKSLPERHSVRRVLWFVLK